MTFTYPERDLDRPDVLLGALGSHWAGVFTNTEQIRSLSLAAGRMGHQTELDLTNAIHAVSRHTVPTYQQKHWYHLTLLESQRNSAAKALLHYGDGAVYGHQPAAGREYQYGVPFDEMVVFPLPSGLREAPFIFNRITSPSVSLTHGLDFQLVPADGLLVFREDPFQNPLIAKREIYTDGLVTDHEISLWVFRAAFDVRDIYQQFGYVLNLEETSSATYRAYINAVWDAVVTGTAVQQIDKAFAALLDTPVVETADELVESIVTDHKHLLVITDKQVYRYPKTATAIVAVGDTVQAGDQLVDTVAIYEFHDGTVPDDLLAIELSRGWLAGDYLGGLTFENKTVPVDVSTDSVFTRIEFEIGGWSGDITKFWDDFHDRGVGSPPTLAQLLDQRTNQVGEPGASALPATINPLEFLAKNILRNHVFVVKIRLAQQGAAALPLTHSRQLRKIIPPHTAMILVVELAVDTESITMDGPGTPTTPGFSGTPELGHGMEPITESIDGAAMITGEPTLQYTEGLCV